MKIKNTLSIALLCLSFSAPAAFAHGDGHEEKAKKKMELVKTEVSEKAEKAVKKAEDAHAKLEKLDPKAAKKEAVEKVKKDK